MRDTPNKIQDESSKCVYHTKENRIRAANDTLAYIEAYGKFKISQRIMYELSAGGSAVPREIISFQLFNSEGENITDIAFNSKAIAQRKADSLAAAMDLSYKISIEETSKKLQYRGCS